MIAEHEVIWVTSSGERIAGRIRIEAPTEVAAAEWRCWYHLDGLPGARRRYVTGGDSLQALWHAIQDVGMWIYIAIADHGVSVIGADEPADADPRAATARTIRMLGPVVRQPLNPRGVADPTGRLAQFESLIDDES